MLRLILFSIVPSICSSSSLAISAESPYVGPKPCSSNKNILGYSSIQALNNDMVFNSLSTSNISNYILCPHTEYDFSSDVMPILPTQNNSKIQCGAKGNSRDMCIISSGKYQIYFHHKIVTENVEFHGFIFKDSNRTSVGAYSNAHSSVKFVDCQWTENEAIMLVEIFHRKETKSSENSNLRARRTMMISDVKEDLELDHENEHASYLKQLQRIDKTLNNRGLETKNTSTIESTYNKGMNVTMEQCSFFGNNKAVTLISTFGGFVELNDCLFLGNNAAAITVGIASNGVLSLKGTTFRMNSNQFSTVFVDPTSSVLTDHDINNYAFAMSGIGNSGNICPDIFIENDGSNCLGNGGFTDECYGTCCYFSDMSCVDEAKNDNVASSTTSTTATTDMDDDNEGIKIEDNLIKEFLVNNTNSSLVNETLFNSNF